MLKTFLKKIFPHRPAGAAVRLLLLLLIFAFINAGDNGAQTGSGPVAIDTDKLIYQPEEQVSFTFSLDSGADTFTGDLVLSVYPAAALSAADAFSAEPLSRNLVESDFTVSGQATASYQASLDDLDTGTGGFPVKVALVNEGGELLAGTSWLGVAEPGAHDPIDLVLLWSVAAPPERDPEQVFHSTRLLERCQNEPRTPDTLIQHPELAGKYPRIKTTYAFEGSMLDQLIDMSDGFRLATDTGLTQPGPDSPEAVAAAGCLENLRALAGSENTEVLLSPYQFASLPLLAREGWDDGKGQYRVGRDLIGEALQLPATPRGSFVPNLDLTTDSLGFISATGGEYAVLAGNISQSVAGRFQPGEILFRLRDLSGERITAIFADDDASGALMGPAPDANAFFAALANAYNAGAPRLLVAASPVLEPPLPAAERDRVYAQLESLPWIESLTLGQAKEKYRPDTEPVTLQRFIDPLEGYITRGYFERLSEVHERFEDYRLAVDTDEPELLRLVKNMYTAESQYFVRPGVSPEEANIGLAYLEYSATYVDEQLAGLTVSVDTPWLQLEKEGEAKVTITNGNPYPFTVDLVISGDDLEFSGEPQRLRLETGSTEVVVPYQAAGWTGISAELQSRGHALTEDGAGIRPMTTQAWIVLIVAISALMGGILYYLLVMRRR